MVVNSQAVETRTPLALAVNLNNDLYLLPSAITLSPAGPPTITGVSGSSDGQVGFVTIAGTNLKDAEVLFDGAPANVVQSNSDGSLVTVTAPPATGAYRATVEALQGDGQTSSQALG